MFSIRNRIEMILSFNQNKIHTAHIKDISIVVKISNGYMCLQNVGIWIIFVFTSDTIRLMAPVLNRFYIAFQSKWQYIVGIIHEFIDVIFTYMEKL